MQFRCREPRAFTASGPSNLPIIAVYTDKNEVSALNPGIATSKDAVQALVQRFAMQTGRLWKAAFSSAAR
ncbi:hypothetical protein KIN20_031515 [Parelaphostrongylus tenuis]|uniref:Uncharacterized protein n=1 Tax=Parelaphostrongylus tenuis TaxID=148309 RepID=A0AAD5R590_PARTN|nr:hypothetical protein KIN20_031515 [Parelaphostrongylus tenuis]